MIWTTLINWFCDHFDSMISYVPEVDFSLPASALSGLNTLTANIGYILPVSDLLVVFDIWLAYMSFRLGVTFYKHRIRLKLK